MEYLKKIGIAFSYTLSILLISTFILTFLNYFNILGSNITSIFKIIIPLISLFIGGFIIGKKSKNKGLIEGLKFSLIFILILILFNYFILKMNFDFKKIIYFSIFILVTIFGSFIGINKKEKQ